MKLHASLARGCCEMVYPQGVPAAACQGVVRQKIFILFLQEIYLIDYID
jgi:hypothetical protein